VAQAIRTGSALGRKLILGAITSLLPCMLIILFILELPLFLPWASQLVPGQTIPPQLDTMVNTIAGNPVLGTTNQTFPVIGITSGSGGFGIGAILFVVAAAMRIAGGFVMRSASKPEGVSAPPQTLPREPPETPTPPGERPLTSSQE
jgi:hypothetical protein